MARQRRRPAEHWPEDFAERQRLAAKYGIAAAENALALLEQARILAEASVLEGLHEDSSEQDDDDVGLEDDDVGLEDDDVGLEDDDLFADDESEDDLLDEMDEAGGAEVWLGDHAQARAFALTVFAAEEVAKAYAATLILTLHSDEDPSAWDGFWSVIQGHHRDKIQAALSLEQVLPRLTGTRQDDLSQSLRDVVNEEVFQQRNRALYVDVADREVRTPDQFARDTGLTDLREALGKSMVTWAIILQGGLKQRLTEIGEEGNTTNTG
jgi:AbiV family abortive infection protein